MDSTREREISQIFVSLAGSLAAGMDLVDMLTGLAVDCSRLLDVASAGLLLADSRGVLHVVAASSEQTRNLELFQLQRDQGPCLDCYHRGQPIAAHDLHQEAARWPQFAEAAINAGFASVHALPMRVPNRILGGLGLFGSQPGALNEEDLLLGQAFADVASIALVQGAAIGQHELLNQQLQAALDSRVVIEQAKGILAQVADLDMDAAFNCLRRYSRNHNKRLSDVAARLVSRQLQPLQLLDHMASRSAPSAST
jgi:transcriptional regulator with GAF, ATPase, and Fis domain